MSLIVDFHIHSHFSRATSKDMNLETIYYWAKIKGINVIGTGDFTHPEYFAEIEKCLEPAEPGLFKLKEKFAKVQNKNLPLSCRDQLVRFILTAEISNIYKKNDKVRKLHNILIAPDFKTVAKINTALGKIGNIQADGRPILGLDSKELLKISLEASKDSFFIPAHIWTPWFAMFGSKSGFDSIEEAFDELTPYIKAVETGLSSDPFMNWRVKNLDGISLVSNSDAHSPKKMGREANLFNCEMDYYQIIEALKTGDERFDGTIEFYPQEGKYHFDGHRTCNICFKPSQSIKHKLICPKCHKPLVLGVDYRVEQLADEKRSENYQPKKHKKVEYIIPLTEILAEINGVKSTSSKKVQEEYFKLIEQFGNEFEILRQMKTVDFKNQGYSQLAEAIYRLRKGQIIVQPGYDGVYGVIKVFNNPAEIKKYSGQVGFGF